MCSMIYSALKRQKSGRTWLSFVDYSIDELSLHLERQFQDGMTWENMNLWHIDHILPRSSFNYQKETDLDFKACWAIWNWCPLWKIDNLKKGSKRTLLI